MTELDLGDVLLAAHSRAAVLDDYVFGLGTFDPALPHHGTPRRCPFCGDVYRVHAGFADHRDRCEERPNPGANPAGSVRTDGGNRPFLLRPCRSRRCGGKVTLHRRIEDREPPAWRCEECLTTFEAVQETLRTDGGSVQRSLDEAANDYPYLADGLTLGTVCEHPPSGAWCVVLDVRDDGRVTVLNLDEVGCDHIALFEDCEGCVEHARLGRDVARSNEGGQYHAAPDAFRVLGPVHPDHQRDGGESA
ncbi:hypothetical protein C2R22_24425 (plasmid) [Salinigranum rubrum]|uniref:C2H2-type domain-containing protein n=1 Tax=Salinigranum rubrum TaxID=755307 RepID=A0A2I8VU21_9EURY|nr:hypothetical protein [Salinigranum rubrum]AUV84679.1 hypothetical protein C2R22_24425 [Salinigranum rubrum]